MNYQALLFKKVAGGWVYRAANPRLFGPAAFYLLDDAQKERVSAILLSADPVRRGLRLGFYVSLTTLAWVFVAAGLMWALGLDADKATPAEFTAFVAIIVLPLIATLPVVALIQRRRLRPILDSAAPTDQRITLADVQEAQKTAAPLYSRKQALGLAAMTGGTGAVMIFNIASRGGFGDIVSYFWLVGALCSALSMFSYLVAAVRTTERRT